MQDINKPLLYRLVYNPSILDEEDRHIFGACNPQLVRKFFCYLD